MNNLTPMWCKAGKIRSRGRCKVGQIRSQGNTITILARSWKNIYDIRYFDLFDELKPKIQ